eukprot:403339939
MQEEKEDQIKKRISTPDQTENDQPKFKFVSLQPLKIKGVNKFRIDGENLRKMLEKQKEVQPVWQLYLDAQLDIPLQRTINNPKSVPKLFKNYKLKQGDNQANQAQPYSQKSTQTSSNSVNNNNQNILMNSLADLFFDESSNNLQIKPIHSYEYYLDFEKVHKSNNQKVQDNNQSYFPTLGKQQNQVSNNPLNNNKTIGNKVGQDSKTQLYFRMIKCDTKLIKSTLEYNDFQFTEHNNFSVCWLGNINNQLNKFQFFENLQEYQKINHFPMSTELTRKDRLAANIHIIPETYILPDQLSEFKEAFNLQAQNNSNVHQSQQTPNIWIVKPSAMSQGKGIFLSNNLQEISAVVQQSAASVLGGNLGQQNSNPTSTLSNNLDSSWVVSRYISNPLLINNLKFDLRIYVLVTSFDPCLKVYIYNEGLVRFATEPFSLQNLNQQCSHLTNYSINKKSSNFYVNKDEQNEMPYNNNIGNKWSITALNKHLPWVLEINLSPSLACEAQLDFNIKSNLVADTLNLVQIHRLLKKEYYAKISLKNNTMQNAKNLLNSQQKKNVQSQYLNNQEHQDADYQEEDDILLDKFDRLDSLREQQLGGSGVQNTQLQSSSHEDYGGSESSKHKQNYQSVKQLMIKQESSSSNIQASSSSFQNLNQPADSQNESINQNENQSDTPEEIVLTGDDLVVEYVSRLVEIIKQKEETIGQIPDRIFKQVNLFIHYKVWSNINLPPHLTRQHQKLQIRVQDMNERKFKLHLSKNGKKDQANELRKEFNRLEQLKMQHLSTLSDRQIENFLFKKVDPSKGNEILKNLYIKRQNGRNKGLLSAMKTLPLVELEMDGEDEESCDTNQSHQQYQDYVNNSIIKQKAHKNSQIQQQNLLSTSTNNPYQNIANKTSLSANNQTLIQKSPTKPHSQNNQYQQQQLPYAYHSQQISGKKKLRAASQFGYDSIKQQQIQQQYLSVNHGLPNHQQQNQENNYQSMIKSQKPGKLQALITSSNKNNSIILDNGNQQNISFISTNLKKSGGTSNISRQEISEAQQSINGNSLQFSNTSPRVKNKSVFNAGTTKLKNFEEQFHNSGQGGGKSHNNNNLLLQINSKQQNDINLPNIVNSTFEDSQLLSKSQKFQQQNNQNGMSTPVNAKKQLQQNGQQQNKLGFTKLEQIYMIKKARKEYGHQYKSNNSNTANKNTVIDTQQKQSRSQKEYSQFSSLQNNNNNIVEIKNLDQ